MQINPIIANFRGTNKCKSHNTDRINVNKEILIKTLTQNQTKNLKNHSNKCFSKQTSNIVSIWKEFSIVTSITSNLSSPKIDHFFT